MCQDMKSSVTINGHLTPLFSITRGVRQGCPISMMVYAIVAEPLNNLIKSQPNIKGIVIILNLYYFNTLTIPLLLFKILSLLRVFFHTVKIFCLGTGAKVNIEKSEVLCLGKTSQIYISFNIPVTVNKDCIQILGIYIGSNKELYERMNLEAKDTKTDMFN